MPDEFAAALALIDRCKDLVADTDIRREAFQRAAARAGVKAEQIAGEYPEPSGKPLAVYYERQGYDRDGKVYAFRSKFKSEAQQRKVFSLIKRGQIPTRRSGKLGRSMTSKAQSTSDGALVWVGTNDQSGPFVLGKAEQSHYHQGTWEPLIDKILRNAPEIVGVFADSLGDFMRGYIAGGRQ